MPGSEAKKRSSSRRRASSRQVKNSRAPNAAEKVRKSTEREFLAKKSAIRKQTNRDDNTEPQRTSLVTIAKRKRPDKDDDDKKASTKKTTSNVNDDESNNQKQQQEAQRQEQAIVRPGPLVAKRPLKIRAGPLVAPSPTKKVRTGPLVSPPKKPLASNDGQTPPRLGPLVAPARSTLPLPTGPFPPIMPPLMPPPTIPLAYTATSVVPLQTLVNASSLIREKASNSMCDILYARHGMLGQSIRSALSASRNAMLLTDFHTSGSPEASPQSSNNKKKRPATLVAKNDSSKRKRQAMSGVKMPATALQGQTRPQAPSLVLPHPLVQGQSFCVARQSGGVFSKQSAFPRPPTNEVVCKISLEEANKISLPVYENIVNFPHLTIQRAYDGKKTCVMCGFARTACKNKKDQPPAPVVLPNRKNICTACLDQVWIVPKSGLEIKWCTICRDFQRWAAFGIYETCVECRKKAVEVRKARASKSEASTGEAASIGETATASETSN